MKNLALLTILSFLVTTAIQAQNPDSITIAGIYKNTLSDTTSYHNLRVLTNDHPSRLAGTAASAKSIKWAEQVLNTMGLDSVWLQECRVRHWERGEQEQGRVMSGKTGNHVLSVCALGGSVGTGKEGLKGDVVEISNYDDLKKLGRENVTGKILFINAIADPSLVNPFASYSGVAGYRVRGMVHGAYYGAIAVIVRSATTAKDDFPHTGIIHYADTVLKIPAFSVSTNDADLLHELLNNDPSLKIYLRSTCSELDPVVSYNIIGEIKGSEKPEEIIAFGGHLDCWDNSDGAHDDGAGVVQTIDVLRLWKSLGMKPKHTLRVIVFMDEEMEQKGAKAYAAATKTEKHVAAIESDRGGFMPQGFSIDAPDDVVKKVQSWRPLFLPYGVFYLEKGGSGVDVRELKQYGASLFGFIPDPQRYFDFHHSGNDTFDKVNIRELQMGTATISTLVYLIDKYGL